MDVATDTKFSFHRLSMNQIASSEYARRLRSLMQSVGVSSFKGLGRAAGVTEWQVRQLGQGKAAQMRVEALQKLSQTLQVSLLDLIAEFSEIPKPSNASKSHSSEPDIETLSKEYERLQDQLTEQKASLKQEFQQTTLQTLESLLLQLPTVAHAVQQNPDLPASRLLPILRPIDQLLKTWDIEAIAPVGSEHPYDPQIHQLMDGTAQVGDRIKIRYTGYRQGEKLLYRAKVSRV